MLKLGSKVTEKATGIKGMLTMYALDESGNEHYEFQPAGLNPKNHEPLDPYWVGPSRVEGGIEANVELPVHMLGTQAEDLASGFKGTIISLFRHLNGCIHVEIKAKGTIEETGESIRAKQFDVRRLKGEAIPVLTEDAKVKSEKETPSPMPFNGMNR